MKKLVVLLLLVVSVFAMVGCGSTASETGSGGYYSNPAKYK